MTLTVTILLGALVGGQDPSVAADEVLRRMRASSAALSPCTFRAKVTERSLEQRGDPRETEFIAWTDGKRWRLEAVGRLHPAFVVFDGERYVSYLPWNRRWYVLASSVTGPLLGLPAGVEPKSVEVRTSEGTVHVVLTRERCPRIPPDVTLLRLEVDPRDYRVRGYTMIRRTIGRTGEARYRVYDVRYSDWKTGIPIPDETFRVRIPSDAKVVDLEQTRR